MGRYWSLEDCQWVEYSCETTETPAATRPEAESGVADEIPQQMPAMPQQDPALR
jgi:hypothetical protein